MESIIKIGTDPVLASIHGFNKSWSKKIIVGLENSDAAATRFEPVVRFCGNDCKGVKINIAKWNNLKNIFPIIETYFNGLNDGYKDSLLYGGTWSLRFTIFYSEHAIQLEEIVECVPQPEVVKIYLNSFG